MLVISRYNEDISWSDCFKGRRIIYDKSDDVIDSSEYVKLPNVGREGHTYLHYIVENYNDLPRAIVFTQGDPSDHVYNMDYFINNVDVLLREKPNMYLPLSNKSVTMENMHDPWDVHMPLSNYWVKIFREPPPIHYNCFFCGIFYTTRALIHRHPLKFYQNMLELMNKENQPYFGYILERLWTALMTTHFHVIR